MNSFNANIKSISLLLQRSLYTLRVLASSLACKTLESFDWPYAAKLLYLYLSMPKHTNAWKILFVNIYLHNETQHLNIPIN